MIILAHFDGTFHHPEHLTALTSVVSAGILLVRLVIQKIKHTKPMPCDTIQTMTVDAGKMDAELAARAIAALGLYGVSYSNGRLTMPSGSNTAEITRQVKQAYSAEVIKAQAKKYGWTLKQTGAFEYAVVKR